MKKEIFRFLYENEAGRDDHFNLPIFYGDDSDLEKHVRTCGKDYMKFNAIGGTLYEAHSTERDLVFRFGDGNPRRDWWYTAVFMRRNPNGSFDHRTERLCYQAPYPVVINQRVVEDFIRKISDAHGNCKGFQLVSVGLEMGFGEAPAPQEAEASAVGEGIPTPKWIRVKDDAGLFSWVPGLMWPDGRVKTIFGDMKDPESEEDTREFDDCPFEGYRIVKEEE